MPVTMYCWRCRLDIPMLTEDEWAVMHPLLTLSIRAIQDYRRDHDAPLHEALQQCQDVPALTHYFALTGFRETNFNVIWHHRVSLYGPACWNCDKPLRTPRATWCAACGAQAT
jgi:hypothetical protein